MATKQITRGSLALKGFIEAEETTQADFARLIERSAPLLNLWVTGERKPGRSNSILLERATRGLVRAEYWDEEPPGTESASGPAQRKPLRRVRSNGRGAKGAA